DLAQVVPVLLGAVEVAGLVAEGAQSGVGVLLAAGAGGESDQRPADPSGAVREPGERGPGGAVGEGPAQRVAVGFGPGQQAVAAEPGDVGAVSVGGLGQREQYRDRPGRAAEHVAFGALGEQGGDPGGQPPGGVQQSGVAPEPVQVEQGVDGAGEPGENADPGGVAAGHGV